jgi:16S rRNA processing protein RimM
VKGNDTRVPLGKLGAAFGVKGWIKVTSHTSPKENILNYPKWQLKIGNDWQVIEVEQSRPHGKTLVAKLAGCEDCDQAQKLVGSQIAIFRSQLPETNDDEYYWSDLLGMQVVTKEDIILGTVKEFIETGSNDVLVVTKKDSGKSIECLIPWLQDDVIINVNQEDRIISVDWDPDF